MTWYDMIWYDMIWYDIWRDDTTGYMIYDMTWQDIYDMIYNLIYDMVWYNMTLYDIWSDIWYDMKINSQGFFCITLRITGYLDFVPMCVTLNRKIKK